MKPREYAMKDMTECHVDIKFLLNEKAILNITSTEDYVRVDFRKFNGGYHPKKNK